MKSLLQSANERYKSFYLFVGKRAAESLTFLFAVFVFHFFVRELVFVGIHFLFVLFDNAFLDDFNSVVVFQFLLHLGVGVVLHTALPAHLRVALAVRAMAFLTIFFPVLFDIRRHGKAR